MARCRTYWGTHGCRFERGHESDCECECADEVTDKNRADPQFLDASRPPYYGPGTRFFGDDATKLRPLAGGPVVAGNSEPTGI